MRSSLLKRLEKLEKESFFVTWYLQQRFTETLNREELEVFALDGKFPDPAPNRSSPLDRLDRNTLLKRWEESMRHDEGRSREDLQMFAKKGLWPEQLGKLHYSEKDRRLYVEWQIEPGPESRVA
jgi:hypothetical protein